MAAARDQTGQFVFSSIAQLPHISWRQIDDHVHCCMNVVAAEWRPAAKHGIERGDETVNIRCVAGILSIAFLKILYTKVFLFF